MNQIKDRIRTFAYSIIFINVLFYVFFFGSIVKNYTNLVPQQGRMSNMKQSGNRIPKYSFTMYNSTCTFFNDGHSFLSLLSNNKKVYQDYISQGQGEVEFYIQKADIDRLSTDQKIFFSGLRLKAHQDVVLYKIIDSFYYTLRSFRGFVYVMASLLLAIAVYITYIFVRKEKKVLFQTFFMFNILFFLLIMLL